MNRPTYKQLEALADFLADNRGIAKGLMRTAHGKYETKKKWQDVAVTLNALGGAHKDGRSWAKYWADKKCALKKICTRQARSSKRTGGEPANEIPSLTPIDKRLAALMEGPEFITVDIPQSSSIHRENKNRVTQAERTVLDPEKSQFTAIDDKRVEAEVITAQSLSNAVDRLGDLAKATEELAVSIQMGAEMIAKSLDRIANALQHR